MFLVQKSGRGKAHRWDGSDTKCRMASTGGLVMHKYELVSDSGGRAICRMCNLRRDAPPAINLDEQFNQMFQE